MIKSIPNFDIKAYYKSRLQRVIDAELDQYDFTLPGHNYMGPGTRVITNLIEDLKPTDYMDQVSLDHDLDYVFAETSSDIIRADIDYVNQSQGIEGVLAAAAIIAKDTRSQALLPARLKKMQLTSDEVNAIIDLYGLRALEWGGNIKKKDNNIPTVYDS